MTDQYDANPPDRQTVDALKGATLIEFGTAWCGHCQAVQPALRQALANYPDLRHLKVEDGKGRPLGRSFGVRLWPTLILLRDGEEIQRMVRPSAQQLHDALARSSLA